MTTPYSKINTPLPEYELSVEGFRAGGDNARVLKQESSSHTNAELGPDIGNCLSVFETSLSNLLESVGKFSPSVELAQNLIDADHNLSEAIEELVIHQQACQRIQGLQRESDKLNQQLNRILVELADCRRSLSALPVLFTEVSADESSKDDSTTIPLSAGRLLEYANKITKFTRAPPGYNSEMPEHANFPWPNEDELRKGVLTMSGLRGDALVSDGAGTTTEAPPSTTDTITTEHPPSIAQNSAEMLSKMSRRRSSAVSYGERPLVAPSAPPGKAILDLDLFDPDEEDEDED
jgi:mediator of RNA polymerase II transcription subunit 4